VIVVGSASAMAVFLGQAGLVPILEVGAVAAAVGWMAACASYYCMKPAVLGRVAALFGVLVTILMVLVKIVPLVPGHFTRYEWLAVAIWLAIGAISRVRQASSKALGADTAMAEVATSTSSQSPENELS